MKLKDLLVEWRAQDVISQLGGNKFIAMTGAKNFIDNSPKRTLSFKLPKAKSGINYIRITLTSMDVYDVEFYALRGTNMKLVNKVKGIYNDQLQNVFTQNTGLRTSL